MSVALMLSACTKPAPPASAHDVFEAGVSLLDTTYAGRSTVSIDEAARDGRRDLRGRCKGTPTECDPLVGYLVLNNVTDALGDRHAALYAPDAWAARKDMRNLELEPVLSFGVSVYAVDARRALVLDVEPGSPAHEAGLQPGDRLTNLNELDGTEPDMRAARTELFDDPPAVSLLVERGSARKPQEFEVTLVRAKLRRLRLPVLYAPADAPRHVRVLRIPNFFGFRRIAPRVHALVRQAQREGATSLIVDLRGGTGGQYIECLVASGAIVGPVATNHDSRHGRSVREWTGWRVRIDDPTERTPPLWNRIRSPLYWAPYVVYPPARWTGATVVLVDEATASCHERMAFLLQRSGIPVLGVPTNGVIDTSVGLYPLPGGGVLQVPDTRSLDANGQVTAERITPNVRVVNDPRAFYFSGEDAMLTAAYRHLERQMRSSSERSQPGGP